MAVKAGGYDESKGRTEGVADFTAAMLRKGTRKRSAAEQIAEAIDRVGGVLGAAADMESSTVNCSVLAKDAALCLDLLAEMVLRPTFPEGEMPEIRDQMLAALAAAGATIPTCWRPSISTTCCSARTTPMAGCWTEEDVRGITRARC